jgi:hypothetical protein
MLQSGVSRQLFDRWATDPKNGVIIAGYAVEHTLAKEILNQPKEVVTLEGRRQALNCLVDYVSFSAHVDFVQNRSFMTQTDPKHIILVHGAKDEMGRLKSALLLQYRQLPEVRVCQEQSVLLFRFTTFISQFPYDSLFDQIEQTSHNYHASKFAGSQIQVSSSPIGKGDGRVS